MALRTDELSALFYSNPPPRGHSQQELTAWVVEMTTRLEAFLRRPEFPGIVLTRIDSVGDVEFFKAEDGMLLYAGPGVVGPQEGLYIRESGAWKKLAGS